MVTIRIRFRIRVRVRVRGGYFLRLHPPYSIAGLADSHIKSFSTVRLGGYFTRSVFPRNLPIIVTVHRETDRAGLIETEIVLIPDAH